MLSGTVAWLLYRAHKERLSGALILRGGRADIEARILVQKRQVVHVEGVPELLSGVADKLPSRDALTGPLEADIPVCLALGLGLDEVLEAACERLGRFLAECADDPELRCGFDPDVQLPPGAFPFPKPLLNLLRDGFRAVHDPQEIEVQLGHLANRPLRVIGEPDEVEGLDAITLRTLKLATAEPSLAGLLSTSGRGQQRRTAEAWYSIDLLMHLGLLHVEGQPIRASAQLAEAREQPAADPATADTLTEGPELSQLESDDESDMVFAMGEDSMDAMELEDDEDFEDEDSQDEASGDSLVGLELEESIDDGPSYTLEDIEDDDSEDDEEVLAAEGLELEDEDEEDVEDGPSHAISWDRNTDDLGTGEVVGGAFESDEDASGIFAMGADDEDFEDEEDDEDFDDIDAEIEALEDEEEDDDDTELAALQRDPGLPDEDLRLPVLETLHESLRKANPLVLLGLSEEQVRGVVSYATLRAHLDRARGRWHQQRFLKADPEVRAAIQRIASLVERRWNALEQPDVLAQALTEWREQLPQQDTPDRDASRRCLARAMNLAGARAWSAALVEAEQAVHHDPNSVRARVLLIQSMVVLGELDIAGGLANLDALLVESPKVKAEIEFAAGQLLKWERHHEQAVERYRRALDMNPRHEDARKAVDTYERRPTRPAQGESTTDEGSVGGFLSGIFGRD